MATNTFNKVLIISSEFPPNVGGIGNHAYNLALALAHEGLSVTVVADIIAVSERELEEFASTQPFTIHWVSRKKLVLQTYADRIVKSLSAAKNADKIICSGKFSLWIAALIKRWFPKKELTAVVHGTELDLRSAGPRRLTAYSLRKFDKIIAVSNYTKQHLPGNLPTRIKQFVIHNGINKSEFDIKDVSPLAGSPALVTVGNVTDRKGQENVINALPEIIKDYPSARYHIIGKPTNKEKIIKLAKSLGVDDRIVFYGAVTRDELLQKLKGAAIKLMLSNHTADGDFEGFGIAVLEANAFGIPAIGSRDCGIADAIEQGTTGLLVDQHNSKEVAEAVKTTMDNYSGFSNHAKNWAIQHDWKMIVKEYIKVLNA